MRKYDDYTLEGQIALGRAVAHFREADKPHWEPYVTEGLSRADIRAERGRWSLDKMVEIINREFGLEGTQRITRDAIHRLENPYIKSKEPPLRLLEFIASLKVMLNPKTGKPFSDADLRLIAKGLLDWKTGEKLDRCYDSQG